MAFRFKGTNHAGQKWRAAGAIVTFGQQIEGLRPGTFKHDGTVASKRHDERSPTSDHRPKPRTGVGVVRALDFTETSPGLVDEVGEALRLSKDPRISYFIHNKRIFSSSRTKKFKAWEWRPYTGSDPHTTHGHLSVVSGELGEQTHKFSISGQGVGQAPAESTDNGEDDMAFTAEEEEFLKKFVKVVSIDMGSSRAFAKSAILDIRKDIITRDELIKFLTDLPTENVEETLAELLKRLRKQ